MLQQNSDIMQRGLHVLMQYLRCNKENLIFTPNLVFIRNSTRHVTKQRQGKQFNTTQNNSEKKKDVQRKLCTYPVGVEE